MTFESKRTFIFEKLMEKFKVKKKENLATAQQRMKCIFFKLMKNQCFVLT